MSCHVASSEVRPDRQATGLDPMLLLVAVVWGLSMVPSKWLLEVMEPAGTLVFRYVVCALVVPLSLSIGTRRGEGEPGRPWGTMVLVGLWVAVQQLLFIYALDLTSASEAALLISLAPIWTALIGVIAGIEMLSGANWLGIGLATVGAALIILGNGQAEVSSGPTRLAGDLLMLLSSLLYGGFMAYSKGVMARWGALRVVSWAFVFGTLAVIPAGLGQFIAADWADFDLRIWGALIYSGLIAGGWGFVVWYGCIARTTPARTAVYQYLVPVVTLAGSAVLLGERMALWQVVGAVVALAGLMLARRPLPRHTRTVLN